jgi:hypothetical protein
MSYILIPSAFPPLLSLTCFMMKWVTFSYPQLSLSYFLWNVSCRNELHSHHLSTPFLTFSDMFHVEMSYILITSALTLTLTFSVLSLVEITYILYMILALPLLISLNRFLYKSVTFSSPQLSLSYFLWNVLCRNELHSHHLSFPSLTFSEMLQLEIRYTLHISSPTLNFSVLSHVKMTYILYMILALPLLISLNRFLYK